MVLKFEIKRHDGPGRLTKLFTTENTFSSPTLIESFEIPPIHLKNDKYKPKIQKKQYPSIGYLPSFHNFSAFSSDSDVIDVFQDVYYELLKKNFDFVIFPIDRAAPYRSSSKYPYFIDKVSKKLPDINFGWVFSFHLIDDLDIQKIINNKLMILGDLSNHANNSRKMWNYLSNALKKFPMALKYAPAVPPIYMPLLAYLGIDFFDTLYAKFMTQSQIFLDWSGKYDISKFKNLHQVCSCRGCQSFEKDFSNKEWLLEHNTCFTENILTSLNLSLENGSLRDLVKRITLVDPSLVALLRLADHEDKSLIEQYVPSFNNKKLFITGFSDFSRPVIQRYRQRLIERFRIPEWTQLILLLPCSAKKPYSESKSHRLFEKAMKGGLGGFRHGITELILTSPLGIVPRYWEKTYPAGYYDIAVTGDWIGEEKKIIENALETIISKIDREISVVAYLYSPEQDIIRELAELHPDWSINILPLKHEETHPDSLKLLRTYLHNVKTSDLKIIPKKKRILEYFRSMADYQFGLPAGRILFPENTVIKQRHMQQIALIDNKQVASLKKIGKLILTAEGGNRLAMNNEFKDYRVTYGGEILQGSAIYTPGIIAADEKIRPEDDVLIFDKNNSFMGIGKSRLSGKELVDADYGLGITIRKKYRL
ncbi:MAG: DUF5591 domain-containing protein [Candidatus Hodarchaeales archaeon]|jgi:archaeosine synthase